MEHVRPLPPSLVERYRAWQVRRSPEDLAQYAEAARKDQSPKAMIITLLRQPGTDLGDLRKRAR